MLEVSCLKEFVGHGGTVKVLDVLLARKRRVALPTHMLVALKLSQAVPAKSIEALHAHNHVAAGVPLDRLLALGTLLGILS